MSTESSTQQPTVEVEFRALIDQDMFDALLSLGRQHHQASFKGDVSIEDEYFCPTHITDFRGIEMDAVGSYSLRLRRHVEQGKSTASLNAKVILNEGDHNAWDEHETEVSSYDQMRKILIATGFKVYFRIAKNRFSFDKDGIHVCLEDIENFQPTLEVEILTDVKQAAKAKQRLLEFLDEIGVREEQVVEKSITNMLMHKHASF